MRTSYVHLKRAVAALRRCDPGLGSGNAPAAVLALGLMLAACGVSTYFPYTVAPYADEFTSERGVAMKNNALPGGNDSSSGLVTLDARRIADAETGPAYVLEVNAYGSDWVNIEPGESLILLLDGVPLRLSGRGSVDARRVDPTSTARTLVTRETAVYPISADDLRRIGAASEVRVRIQGSARRIERTFSPTNIARFRDFAAQYATP